MKFYVRKYADFDLSEKCLWFTDNINFVLNEDIFIGENLELKPIIENDIFNYKFIDGKIIERTQSEKDADFLRLKKVERKKEVQAKTDLLCEQGFIFNKERFGSSKTDQINWNTLLNLKNEITYPNENIVKKWDGTWYTIENEQEIVNIVLTGMNMVNGYRASHKVLIDSIDACQSIDELNNVIDDRT